MHSKTVLDRFVVTLLRTSFVDHFTVVGAFFFRKTSMDQTLEDVPTQVFAVTISELPKPSFNLAL